MVEAKPVRYFRTPRAKPGPARIALDSALDGRDLAGLDGITAEIARGAADLVDAARRAQDPKLWLSASSRLLALMGQLDERPPAVPDDDGARGDEPDDPGGLGAVLGAGPTMGDAEES